MTQTTQPGGGGLWEPRKLKMILKKKVIQLSPFWQMFSEEASFVGLKTQKSVFAEFHLNCIINVCE